MREVPRTTTNRFPNTTSPSNPLVAVRRTAVEVQVVRREYAKNKRKPTPVSPRAKRGPRFSIEVDFSKDGGDSFDKGFKAAASTTYQMRARFTQHQAEPLLQGVVLEWYLPSGWTFRDGWGSRTLDTCISNPLHLSRLIRSPSPVTSGRFKVLCVAIYP